MRLNTLKRWVMSASMVMAGAAMVPAQAYAEDVVIIFTPGLTTTTTTGVVITVSDGILSTTSSTSDTLFGSQAQLQLYLDENAVALSQSIAMGAGTAVTDLAHVAGVSPQDQAAFGRLLQQQRAALLPLLGPADGEVTAQAARDFEALVVAALRADATLSKYAPST